MNFYDGIIVVEGRGDEAFLSSFIDSIYVVTNGFELNKKDIDFLVNHLPFDEDEAKLFTGL